MVPGNYDDYVRELLVSYERVGGLNNRDAHNMPSKRAVGQICGDFSRQTHFRTDTNVPSAALVLR